MTPFSPARRPSAMSPPVRHREIAVAENAWMILWRTLWLDLPSLGAGDRPPPCWMAAAVRGRAGAGDGTGGRRSHEPAEASRRRSAERLFRGCPRIRSVRAAA